MSKNVLGYPSKPLSEQEKTIRAVKGLRGQPDGFVGTDGDGLATTSHLGTGTASSTTILYGNNVWGAAAGALVPGDYGDVEVVTGTNWTVEQYANRYIVEVGTNLQALIDSLGTAATLILNKGTYYADSGTPSTPLTITDTHHSLQIIGMGDDYSVIASPILLETSKLTLEHLWLKPVGTAYGLKIFKSGSFLSRCALRKVRVGATYEGAGDGPVDGIVLDGAGLLVAEQVNSSFNTGSGLLVDSTVSVPNTTLRFTMCTFNGNGGYGIKLLGSCSIAEFLNGNAEGNTLGELSAASMNNLRIIGFDFESTGIEQVILYQVDINNCNPVTIMDCNFLTGVQDVDDPSPGATRVTSHAISINASGGVVIQGNRFAGFTSRPLIRVGNSTVTARVSENVFEQSLGYSWVEDYSRP